MDGSTNARVEIDSNGVVELDLSSKLQVRAINNEASIWSPIVLHCGFGSAAAHVEGRIGRAPLEVCEAVLLLNVPAGDHTLILSSQTQSA